MAIFKAQSTYLCTVTNQYVIMSCHHQVTKAKTTLSSSEHLCRRSPTHHHHQDHLDHPDHKKDYLICAPPPPPLYFPPCSFWPRGSPPQFRGLAAKSKYYLKCVCILKRLEDPILQKVLFSSRFFLYFNFTCKQGILGLPSVCVLWVSS